MSKPDRVRISIGRTWSIQKYDVIRVDVGLESDVRADETLEDTKIRLTLEAVETVKATMTIAEEETGLESN